MGQPVPTIRSTVTAVIARTGRARQGSPSVVRANLSQALDQDGPVHRDALLDHPFISIPYGSRQQCALGLHRWLFELVFELALD